MATIEKIGVGLALLAFLAVLAKGFQIRKRIRKALVQEPDGTLRKPTDEESQMLAQMATHERGAHFWHIVAAGFFLIIITWLTLKLTGHFGTEQSDAAMIHRANSATLPSPK
jgi:hypothetical protein